VTWMPISCGTSPKPPADDADPDGDPDPIGSDDQRAGDHQQSGPRDLDRQKQGHHDDDRVVVQSTMMVRIPPRNSQWRSEMAPRIIRLAPVTQVVQPSWDPRGWQGPADQACDKKRHVRLHVSVEQPRPDEGPAAEQHDDARRRPERAEHGAAVTALD